MFLEKKILFSITLRLYEWYIGKYKLDWLNLFKIETFYRILEATISAITQSTGHN